MKEELDRKYKVINMMITMHSILYHHSKNKALIGNIFFLITAIILNAFIFFDYKYLEFLKIDANIIKNIINLSSFTIFLLSVIYLLIDWSKKAEKHALAINQLSKLLNELRRILQEDEHTLTSKTELFDVLYNQTFETIPQIPNRHFNKLKAKHYRKVELSKFIDNHKGRPFFVIRVLFFLKIFSKNG